MKVLSWIYEHTNIFDNIFDLEKQLATVGECGLIMPIIGSECKTCFQSLVEHWIGTEQLCYMLADEPEAVEELLMVMRSVSRKTVTISAQSKGEAFIFWEDSSTTNIGPSMFTRYTLPEIDDWADILHEQGKLLVHHACGHLNALLPLIAQSKIDVLESASPPPSGNVTMVAIRTQLPQHIALIGGIEPAF